MCKEEKSKIMKSFQPETYALEIRSGNRLAFSDFFRKNHDQYVRYAMRFVNEKADALDIVQDVFVKLWKNRLNIDPQKSIVSYLYTSVRNQSLNFIRDHSSKKETLDEEIIDEIELEENDSSNLLQALKTCITELPERQREAFELSRFEGLQHHEIAEIMNLSSRTVNNHIVTALKILRDKLQLTQRTAVNQ